MIHLALQALVVELEAYLKRTFDLVDGPPIVLLTALAAPDGSVLASTRNKLCLTLVSLEQENTVHNGPTGHSIAGSTGAEPTRANPAVRLDLRVVLTANFDDYAESLKFLSAAIACFQRKSVLTPQNSPGLPPQFNKLIVESESPDTQEWSFLWGMLGTKCMPAAAYKIRMLTLQEAPDGQALAVTKSTGPQISS